MNAPGNAILVGHRVTIGAALHRLARVHVGDSVVLRTATYQVTSTETMSRSALARVPVRESRLVFVTAASLFDTSRVRVDVADVVGVNSIRFEGTPPPPRGTPAIPGTDFGRIGVALLCSLLVLLSCGRGAA